MSVISSRNELRRLAEQDQQLAVRFPSLALSVYTSVANGQRFDQPRDDLGELVVETLRHHAVLEEALLTGCGTDPGVRLLGEASAAQHRTLAAHVDELRTADIGLDVVGLTRALHALLALHRDLERIILDRLLAT